MVKLFVMIPRAPHVSKQEFHDHWRHPHATLGLDIPGMCELVQSHQFHTDLLPPGQDHFEGIGEAWFDSVDTAVGMAEDRHYKTHVQPDEVNFIDLPKLEYLFTDEEILVEGVTEADGAARPEARWRERERPTSIKVLQFVRDAPGWATDRDRELGLRVGALRHVRSHASSSVYTDGAPPWLGVRELWWPTLSDFEAGVAADAEAWRELRELGGSSGLTGLFHAERWTLQPAEAA